MGDCKAMHDYAFRKKNYIFVPYLTEIMHINALRAHIITLKVHTFWKGIPWLWQFYTFFVSVWIYNGIHNCKQIIQQFLNSLKG